jgi:hypothetical protein
VAPRIWLDEHGQRRPTRLCWKCDREWPVLRLRYEDLLVDGWKPMKTMSIVNWCGHGQEFVPVPEAHGYWLFVPIMGETA